MTTSEHAEGTRYEIGAPARGHGNDYVPATGVFRLIHDSKNARTGAMSKANLHALMLEMENALAALASTPSPAQPTEAWKCSRKGCPLPSFHGHTEYDPDEWTDMIAEEREHQREKGYDAAHDAEHGVNHLLSWSQEYARKGDTLAAAALVEAARELLLAPSPVQGADDRLAQAEAVDIERVIWLGLKACIESAEVPTGVRGGFLGEIYTIRERVDLHDVVRVIVNATYQQSPQAALNEVRAWRPCDTTFDCQGTKHLEECPVELRARAAEYRAQTGAAG